MDEKEIKETKEQENNINGKEIAFLIIRIILCIIAIGFSILLVFASMENASTDVERTLDSTLVSAHNLKFTIYEGNSRSASEVRALLLDIASYNGNNEIVNTYGEIKVNLIRDGSSGDEFNDLNNSTDILKRIRNSRYYQIRVTNYNNYGCISRLVIREQSSRDDVIDIPMDQYNDVLIQNKSSNNAIQNDNSSFKLIAYKVDRVARVIDLISGTLAIILFTIILINTFIILINKKYSKINATIDRIQIRLLFIPISIILFLSSLEAVMLRMPLLSIIVIIIFIGIIVYYNKSIKLLKTYDDFDNRSSIIARIILFMVLDILLIISSIASAMLRLSRL